jgi:hypothetical protein
MHVDTLEQVLRVAVAESQSQLHGLAGGNAGRIGAV